MLLSQRDQHPYFCPHDASRCHVAFRRSVCHFAQAQSEKKALIVGKRLVTNQNELEILIRHRRPEPTGSDQVGDHPSLYTA